MGFSLERLGKVAKALVHMNMALAIRRETLGDKHPDTIRSWELVVRLLLHQHKKADALMLVDGELKKFPYNAALKRLKNEVLGKLLLPIISHPHERVKLRTL